MDNNNNKLLKISILSLLLLLPIVIYVFYKFWISSTIIPSQAKISFPLSNKDLLSDAQNPNYFYGLNCVLTNIDHVDIDYKFGDKDHESIKILTLATCKYLRNSNEKQEVLVVLSAVQGNENEEFFAAYGNRSISLAYTKENAKLFTSDILMNKWSEYLNKHYDNSKQIEVDKGDLVSLNLVQPGNEIVNQNIISPNGTSDLVYGKGFAQHIDLKSFYDTGDLSNLPIINNKPLLPTLRVNFLEDK